MRDFYVEFLESKSFSAQEDEQLPKLPKGQESVRNPTYGSNGSSFDAKLEETNVDSWVAAEVSDINLEGLNWIHQYNPIDAYQAKLARIRRDPELAGFVDTLYEERKAIMLQGGSTEQEADEHVSSIEFLAWVLMNV
jgi:hypothetical protein